MNERGRTLLLFLPAGMARSLSGEDPENSLARHPSGRNSKRVCALGFVAAAVVFMAAPARACDESQQVILARNPDATDARYELARACAKAGRHEEALVEYDRLLATDAGNADWLLGKGQALMALGRPGEALPYLERARAAAPNYEDVKRAEANARAALETEHAREHGTRVSLAAAHEDLSGGRPSWQSLTLGVDKMLAARRHFFGGIHVEERFDEQDEQFSLGWADRAGGWSYGISLDVAPDAEILPEWNLVAEAGHALPSDMAFSLRARHASYETVDVDSLAAGVEKYLSQLRLGYTLTAAQPSDLDWSFSHTLRLARDYGDASHVTLALGYGDEAETIAPGVVLVTDIRSVSINGLHWRNATWGFTWEAGWYEQGDLYERVRVSLGLQYRF